MTYVAKITRDSGQGEGVDGCEAADGCDGGNMHEGSFEKFAELLGEAKQELYPGCSDFSSLTFLVKLKHIKVLNRLSNNCFDMLLKLLKEAFPNVRIPETHYDAKKMLHDLGLGYEAIHACKYDCALFWKEHEGTDDCLVCGEPRYKKQSITNSANREKVPYNHRAAKVPCHCELKKRTREQPSSIQIFHDTHYSEVTGWINDEARSRYERMVELKQQNTLEGSITPCGEDEICDEVLGKKSKPPPNTAFTSSTAASNEVMDELRMIIMTQDEKLQSQKDEIQQYKDKLKKMEDDNESFRWIWCSVKLV